jgi:hypothetical protein
MKKIIILFAILVSAVSCAEEDDITVCQDPSGNFVDCNIINNDQQNPNNGDNGGTESQFAQSDFIIQTGAVTYDLNNNSIKVPLRTKGISMEFYRADIVIWQNGQKLPGVIILEKGSENFFNDNWHTVHGTILATNASITIQLYVAETNATRELVDSIALN